MVTAALCPSCAPVLEARSLVFSDAFMVNLTYALLPFVVVSVLVYRFVVRLDRGDAHED